MLVIIPARGGSKGIPRKNVLPLAGKPLIAYAIQAAKQSNYVTRIVVSTDDPEIGSISQQYGAEVVWRPAAISGDLASSEQALLDTLTQLEDTEGYRPNLVIFMQCTSPLTLPEDIDKTINALLEQNAETALTVSANHRFLWRSDKETGAAYGINHDKSVRLLRQQIEPEYVETGAVYVMKADLFRQHKHRFFGKTALSIIPDSRSIEIDSLVDWHIVEVLMRERQQAEHIEQLPAQIRVLALDFDGVFTNNKVLVTESGEEAVLCHRGDGMGIAQLKKVGIPIIVLSSEPNPVVRARCKKLDIECRSGLTDKLAILKEWLASKTLSLDHTVFLGNDVNDLDCLMAVGCGVVVGDAHPAVISAADIVLENFGGHGAIRELTDLIVEKLKIQ